MEIPLEIEPNECLVRIILHSFHYSESKKKVMPEAFLPSPVEKDEISVLRFNYSDANFCKRHGLQIAESKSRDSHPCKFIGVVCLYVHEILCISEKATVVSCQPNASPLDEKNEVRIDRPILKGDPGLPMHADLKYSFKITQDKPMNQFLKQQIIKEFCIKANDNRLFRDLNLGTSDWSGDVIILT